jgi:hypothetical protein
MAAPEAAPPPKPAHMPYAASNPSTCSVQTLYDIGVAKTVRCTHTNRHIRSLVFKS